MSPELEIVGGAEAPGPEKKYTGSIYASGEVSPMFVRLVRELETKLDRPIWLLVQPGPDREWDAISSSVFDGFYAEKGGIPVKGKAGLLIHSPGGFADQAYKIIRLFQRRVSDLLTIVPCYAKSAATLMTIGGNKVLMGSDAELGPLDVQMFDDEQESYDSALNAVQSLERLNSYALSMFDQMMFVMVSRTGKRIDKLLPQALDYAKDFVRPLVDKIDTIDVTRKSRELKVAEDYATRLMRGNYDASVANSIADALVSRYSTHGFVIDRTEAGPMGPSMGPGSVPNLGLHMYEPTEAVEALLTDLVPELGRTTVIGRIVEQKSEPKTAA